MLLLSGCVVVLGLGHAPENIRMVNMPDREIFSPFSGFGVVAREGGIGVTERETTPGSLVSFDSGDAMTKPCVDTS